MLFRSAFIPVSTQVPVFAMPASSLNGQINTTLFNNVVTTKITPELTNKITYRYYNFQNNTPELLISNWVPFDSIAAGANPLHTTRSLSISYTKQNVGEELVWRPSREWTFGAVYGFERYSWARADVGATNENAGKLFADYKPWNWLTARSSVTYGNRRYQNYDYWNRVGSYQWPLQLTPPTTGSFAYPASYRQLMFSNRETWKGNFAVDIVVVRGLTITPTLKYQDEQYSVNPQNQQGLKDRKVWSAGIDTTYLLSPSTSVMVGYNWDYYNQLMFGTNCTNNVCAPANFQTQTNNSMTVHSVTFLLRHAAIPDKLDTDLRYVASRGADRINLFLGNGALPTGGQFPDMTTWYQRLDATATYKFDKDQVARLGWNGDVRARLRYTWERNSVSWYASDIYAPGYSTNVFIMGWDNPNYNVHLMAASLAWSW